LRHRRLRYDVIDWNLNGETDRRDYPMKSGRRRYNRLVMLRLYCAKTRLATYLEAFMDEQRERAGEGDRKWTSTPSGAAA
jgi:hypothetical protein